MFLFSFCYFCYNNTHHHLYNIIISFIHLSHKSTPRESAFRWVFSIVFQLVAYNSFFAIIFESYHISSFFHRCSRSSFLSIPFRRSLPIIHQSICCLDVDFLFLSFLPSFICCSQPTPSIFLSSLLTSSLIPNTQRVLSLLFPFPPFLSQRYINTHSTSSLVVYRLLFAPLFTLFVWIAFVMLPLVHSWFILDHTRSYWFQLMQRWLITSSTSTQRGEVNEDMLSPAHCSWLMDLFREFYLSLRLSRQCKWAHAHVHMHEHPVNTKCFTSEWHRSNDAHQAMKAIQHTNRWRNESNIGKGDVMRQYHIISNNQSEEKQS